MNNSQILPTLVYLKSEALQRYKAELKGIFGSFTRGEAHSGSDIDILVEFQPGATLLDLSGLGDFLEERLHRKVDLVTTRAVRSELRAQIYADLVCI